MKIKSSRFSTGYLSRVSPYEVNKSTSGTLQYKLVEGCRYLIHLPDGKQLTGIFYKKGLDGVLSEHEESEINAQHPSLSSNEIEVIQSSSQQEAMEVDSEDNFLLQNLDLNMAQDIEFDGNSSKSVLQVESPCHHDSQNDLVCDNSHDLSSQAKDASSSNVFSLNSDSSINNLHSTSSSSSLITQTKDSKNKFLFDIHSKELKLEHHVILKEHPDLIQKSALDITNNTGSQDDMNLHEDNHPHKHTELSLDYCHSKQASPLNTETSSEENSTLATQEPVIQTKNVSLQRGVMYLKEIVSLFLHAEKDCVHKIENSDNACVEKVLQEKQSDEEMQLDASLPHDSGKSDSEKATESSETTLFELQNEHNSLSTLIEGTSSLHLKHLQVLDNSSENQPAQPIEVDDGQVEDIQRQPESIHLQSMSSCELSDDVQSSVTKPEETMDIFHKPEESLSNESTVPMEESQESKVSFMPLSLNTGCSSSSEGEISEALQQASEMKTVDQLPRYVAEESSEPEALPSNDLEPAQQSEMVIPDTTSSAAESTARLNLLEVSSSTSEFPSGNELVTSKESSNNGDSPCNLGVALEKTMQLYPNEIPMAHSSVAGTSQTPAKPGDSTSYAGHSFCTKEEPTQFLMAASLSSSALRVQTPFVCTVAPTAKPGNLKLMSSIASPVVQGKPSIFITQSQFKVLANICKQNSPKATAFVVPNTHMKAAEEEVHVLSSDEEEGSDHQSRSILTPQLQQQTSSTGSSGDVDFLLSCPLRQSFFGMERGSVLRICKLAFEVFRLSNVNGTVQFDIPLKEVSKMLIHHGLCGPVFFLSVSEDLRKQVQARFAFGIETFNPASSNPGKSYVVFVPSKKNNVERDNLGQAAVMAIVENVCRHMLDKFGHRIQTSILSGGETSQLIASVLGVPPSSLSSSTENNQTPPSASKPVPSARPTVTCSPSVAAPITACQVTLATPQITPSFVIVGGSQPINIVGSNSINITNNIFNINMPNKGSLSSPKTQIIVLAKKIAGLPAADKSQEPKNRGPIISLFTYPPTPGPGRMTITTEDYYCLNEGELLNDNIIDFYLKYFLEEHLNESTRSAVHLFSSFFYGKIVSEDRMQEPGPGQLRMTPQQVRHSRVRTWTRHVDLFSKDFIIIPIIESSHWFLAVICFPGLKNAVIEQYRLINSAASGSTERQGSDIRLKQPCIIIFDSLGMIGHQTVTRTLREYLQEEWNLKKKSSQGEREFTENTFPGFNPTCPQQNNSTDCGVFVLKYVESFFQKPIRDFIMPISNTAEWFTQDAIREKRKEIQQLILRLHGSDHIPGTPKL